jgi:hypothetical protein
MMKDSTLNPFERGSADARQEIEAGKPRLFWQTRGAWGTFLTNLFRERYGVHVDHTDCFAWPGLNEYRDGYNAEVVAYLDRKHGAGTFERALAEVEEFRRKSYLKQKDNGI